MTPARSSSEASVPSESVPIQCSGKRRYRSKQERRRIVEETLAPGASVARVARAHDVNANQVHGWRALYRQGLLGGAEAGEATLVPVSVTDAPDGLSGAVRSAARIAGGVPALIAAERDPAEPGAIHVQLRGARLRIEGQVDLAALRAVLEALGG